MPAILNYLIHLLLAAALLIAFFIIYTRVTPYDEVLLIRQGNQAAALSLGGALLGFSATIASSLMHTADYQQFFAWAFGAMVVQLLAYVSHHAFAAHVEGPDRIEQQRLRRPAGRHFPVDRRHQRRLHFLTPLYLIQGHPS